MLQVWYNCFSSPKADVPFPWALPLRGDHRYGRLKLIIMTEAEFYKKSRIGIECLLCNRFCKIKNGDFGFCKVRKNIDGVLYSVNYGKIICQNIDPIEKKPIRNYLPRTMTYSIASLGCNFKCLGCQNWSISQVTESILEHNNSIKEVKPEDIIILAQKYNCPSISYTYTEPTVFAEFAIRCMKLANENNIKNIWVSNGYMSDYCLEEILPLLDAINIDLKFFDIKSYFQYCSSQIDPVLNNLVKIKRNNVHLEVATLLIPGVNDSKNELTKIALFIKNQLGEDTPWHINTFYPAYKMKSVKKLFSKSAAEADFIGKEAGLLFVYS